MAERKHKYVAVMLDTKGPEIRTGFYAEGVKTVEYVKDTMIRVVPDYTVKG